MRHGRASLCLKCTWVDSQGVNNLISIRKEAGPASIGFSFPVSRPLSSGYDEEYMLRE